MSPEISDGASQPLENRNDQMEDAALEGDLADDQPQVEVCDMLTHQSTDSLVREKTELPASASSTSPAGGLDHSPRPGGFGKGTGNTEQSTESRSGGSGARGRGRSSSTQQARTNLGYQFKSSPMLTRKPIPELCLLLLLQTRQTTQCLAAEQPWIPRNPRFFACQGVCQQRRQRHPRETKTVRPKP